MGQTRYIWGIWQTASIDADRTSCLQGTQIYPFEMGRLWSKTLIIESSSPSSSLSVPVDRSESSSQLSPVSPGPLSTPPSASGSSDPQLWLLSSSSSSSPVLPVSDLTRFIPRATVFLLCSAETKTVTTEGLNLSFLLHVLLEMSSATTPLSSLISLS